MATVKHVITENDVVELLDAAKPWPPGTRGTVISERCEHKLVEISDERGVALGCVSVVEPRLKLVAEHCD